MCVDGSRHLCQFFHVPYLCGSLEHYKNLFALPKCVEFSRPCPAYITGVKFSSKLPLNASAKDSRLPLYTLKRACMPSPKSLRASSPSLWLTLAFKRICSREMFSQFSSTGLMFSSSSVMIQKEVKLSRFMLHSALLMPAMVRLRSTGLSGRNRYSERRLGLQTTPSTVSSLLPPLRMN
jgi:hypothetical protein